MSSGTSRLPPLKSKESARPTGMGFFSKLSLASSSASSSNYVQEMVNNPREKVSFKGLDDLVLLQTLGALIGRLVDLRRPRRRRLVVRKQFTQSPPGHL
eukprot:150498-Prorocentrum_minimum.AAC.4